MIIDNYWLKLNINMFNQVDLFLSERKVLDYIGILSNIPKEESRFSYDSFRRQSTTTIKDNTILRLYINLSKNTYITKEPLKICTIFGLFITYFFDKHIFLEKMVNLYFEMNQIYSENGTFEVKEKKLAEEKSIKINKSRETNAGIIIKNNYFKEIKDKRKEIVSDKTLRKEIYIKSANIKNIVNKELENKFKISYIDILGMIICCFNKKYNNKKRVIQLLDKKMNLFTDMTEIVKTVIKNKYYHREQNNISNIFNIEDEAL